MLDLSAVSCRQVEKTFITLKVNLLFHSNKKMPTAVINSSYKTSQGKCQPYVVVQAIYLGNKQETQFNCSSTVTYEAYSWISLNRTDQFDFFFNYTVKMGGKLHSVLFYQQGSISYCQECRVAFVPLLET